MALKAQPVRKARQVRKARPVRKAQPVQVALKAQPVRKAQPVQVALKAQPVRKVRKVSRVRLAVLLVRRGLGQLRLFRLHRHWWRLGKLLRTGQMCFMCRGFRGLGLLRWFRLVRFGVV